jgi:hypothetical protein
LLREPIGGAEDRGPLSGRAFGIVSLERAPLVAPEFIPRSPENPPALGGRGTFVRIIGRFSGIRMLLFAVALRFGTLSAGRCTFLFSDAGPWFRPRFWFCPKPLFLPASFRPALFGPTFRFCPNAWLRIGLGLPEIPWL